MSDTATEPETRPAGGVVPQPGPLGRLARVTYRRRGRTVLAWVAALALAIGLSAAFAGSFSADYSAPGVLPKGEITPSPVITTRRRSLDARLIDQAA